MDSAHDDSDIQRANTGGKQATLLAIKANEDAVVDCCSC